MLDNEAAWIADAQNGSDEAFAHLVTAYQRPIYNLCYRMLGNAGDAEDAAQETFIRAYKAIKRYDPNRKFSTWLLTIASNYCIDQHRRKKLPTFSYDGFPNPDIQDDSIGMDMKILRNEEKEKIQVVLEKLNSKDRAAVVMRYWYDYSYDEIAESLSLTVSAVKSRLHRARRDLAGEWLDMQKRESYGRERTQYETSTF